MVRTAPRIVLISASVFVLSQCTASHTGDTVAQPFVHECDLLAASPYDSNKAPVKGLLAIPKDAADRAIIACREASESHPALTRFEYQLGRALWYAGHKGSGTNLFRIAMRRHYPAAYAGFGYALESGEYGRSSPRLAVNYYRRAYALGSNSGQLLLAMAHMRGVAMPPDCKTAELMFKGLEKTGDSFASYGLGLAKENDECGRVDLNAAFDWYLKSAQAGNKFAMLKVSSFYRLGLAPSVNMKEANRWRERADGGRGVPLSRGRPPL